MRPSSARRRPDSPLPPAHRRTAHRRRPVAGQRSGRPARRADRRRPAGRRRAPGHCRRAPVLRDRRPPGRRPARRRTARIGRLAGLGRVAVASGAVGDHQQRDAVHPGDCRGRGGRGTDRVTVGSRSSAPGPPDDERPAALRRRCCPRPDRRPPAQRDSRRKRLRRYGRSNAAAMTEPGAMTRHPGWPATRGPVPVVSNSTVSAAGNDASDRAQATPTSNSRSASASATPATRKGAPGHTAAPTITTAG